MATNKKTNIKKSPMLSSGSTKKQLRTSPPAHPRNALGRGLSALIKPVSVQPSSSMLKEATARSQVLVLGEDIAAREQIVTSSVQSNVVPFHELTKNSEGANEKKDAQSLNQEGLVSLSIQSVITNKNQPRKFFSEEEINSLSQSIRETGLLQPILVRRITEQTGMFEIVAGERRFRAAKKAGLQNIPAIIRDLNDCEALEIGIIENVQRSDLNPIEEALAYQRLIDEYGQTQSEVAQSVGKDRVSIANAIRLLKLPNEVLTLLEQKKLSAGHGRAVLMLENPRDQIALANKILKEGISVREAEKQAQRKLEQKQSSEQSKKVIHIKDKSFAVIELEDRLRRALGTKVSLNITPSGEGDLKISFFSKDELQSLLERIGV